MALDHESVSDVCVHRTLLREGALRFGLIVRLVGHPRTGVRRIFSTSPLVLSVAALLHQHGPGTWRRLASGEVDRGWSMRVHVDREKCQGHNRCYALAPELFDVDELGNAFELNDGEVASGLEDKARRAVNNCPEYAISISE
jgi:ferredoxin